MIGIIDYGLGNLKSFSNILKRFNSEFLILKDNKDFDKCSKFILPGVGSFDEAIKRLKSKYKIKYQSFFNLYENYRYKNKNIQLTTILRTLMSSK